MLHAEIKQPRKAKPRNNSSKDSEKHDVVEVFKELALVHVETGAHEYKRDKKVEENLLVELSEFQEFLISNSILSVGNNHAYAHCQDARMAKARFLKVNKGSRGQVEDDQERNQNGTLTVSILCYFLLHSRKTCF